MIAKPAYSAELIGQRIATLRKALGLSRKDLAAAIGLGGESSISEIENGRNTKKLQDLAELAITLGTTPNQLLGFDEELPLPVDKLDMMGATVQLILMGEGWSRERAEALVGIAIEVASEKAELDLDRRLAAACLRRALGPTT